MNEKQSLQRPAWTQSDLGAYNHLHQPVRNKYGKVVAPVKIEHFARTKGFLHLSELQSLGGNHGN